MLVSLFADASYRDTARLATWGTYHVRGEKRMEAGGIIKGPVHNSTDAEVMAIIKGLEHCLANQEVVAGDHFIIQTDSSGAIGQLYRQQPIVWAMTKDERDMRWAIRHRYYTVGLPNLFWMFVYKQDIKIELRHVKGHSSHQHRTDKDPQRKRTWANQRCDTIAGNYMAQALKHLDHKKTA